MIELPLIVDMEVESDAEYEMEIGTVPNLPNVCVKGSFIANESGIQTISVPYNGNGYPIAVEVMVDGGITRTSPYINLKQNNAVGFICLIKNNPGIEPMYRHYNEDTDSGIVTALQTSSTGSVTRSLSEITNCYTYSDPTTNYATNILKIPSSKEFKFIITNGTAKGLLPNWKYNYFVVYSE